MDRGYKELGVDLVFSTVQQLWFSWQPTLVVTSPANHTASLAMTPGEIKKPCLILTCSILVHPRINAFALLGVNHMQLQENWAAYSRAISPQEMCTPEQCLDWSSYLYAERASPCRLARGSAGAQPWPPVHSSKGPQAAWKAAVSVQGQDVCAQRSLGSDRDRRSHAAQAANLLLPLESMYVTVSYTIYKSLGCFRQTMYADSWMHVHNTAILTFLRREFFPCTG